MIILHVVIHPKVSMAIFPQEFHEDDEYNRACTAFKVGRFRCWDTASTLHNICWWVVMADVTT